MRDGLPGVVFLVVSLPTNFVKISPYFTITNQAVKILTNCHNLLRNPLHWPICVLRKCIPHRVKVWRDCPHSISSFPLSQIPIRGCLASVSCTLLKGRVVSDATGVEIFFLSRAVSASGTARRFCAALPPSPCHTSPLSNSRSWCLLWHVVSEHSIFFWIHQKKICEFFFFTGWTVCHGHASVGGARGTKVRWYYIFILLSAWSGESSGELETWERRGENLDYQW